MYHFELNPARKNTWDREVEKFFDVFSKNDYFAPACEILDEEKSFSISMDIPGLNRDEISIEVKDNKLFVTGERKQVTENSVRSERRYGKFSRIFSLPQNANADGIEAQYKDGVLDLKIPKEEKTQTRKISISDWAKPEVSSELKN